MYVAARISVMSADRRFEPRQSEAVKNQIISQKRKETLLCFLCIFAPLRDCFLSLENVLRNLRRFDAVTRHVEGNPEHGRIVGLVEGCKRAPIPIAKPFREVAIGSALAIHAWVSFQKLGPHHGCTTVLPPGGR